MSMRVAPRAWLAFAIVAGYAVLVLSIQLSSGLPYDEWGASAQNLLRGAVVSLTVAAVVLTALTSLLGWWRPAMVEDQRSPHRWAITGPGPSA